jgi:general secretion pathway protein F
MPSFRYSAITPQGEMVQGVLDAADQAAAVEQIRKQGQLPVRAEPAEKSGNFLESLLRVEFGGPERLSTEEVTNLTRELAVMLGAGQDLDRAMRFMVDTAPSPRAKRILTKIRDAVRDGSPLAAALAHYPQSFPRLYIGLVRAGEAGGKLAPTLERLAELLERQRELRSTVISAMIYPAILLVAGTGAIVMLLTQVLPQFVPMFEQAGATLPALTRFVIAAGDVVSRWGLPVLFVLLIGGVAAREALKRPGPRLWFDRTMLHIPVFGPVAREVLAARFARTLGTLLSNGVPLVAALSIVVDVIGNAAAELAVREAAESAKGGAGLARPLQQAGIFPIRTIYLLRLGEETAQLGAMALRAAEIHETQSKVAIDRMVALMVPVLILFMAVGVAGIVSSLLLAMLSLNDLAQ